MRADSDIEIKGENTALKAYCGHRKIARTQRALLSKNAQFAGASPRMRYARLTLINDKAAMSAKECRTMPPDTDPRSSSTTPVREEEGAAVSNESNAPRLLAIVRELVEEMQPRSAGRRDIRLDSDLDRDLALDSLARAELMLRLDREFHVRLPDRLIAEASTPRDLLDAMKGASPRAGERLVARPAPLAALPTLTEPVETQTLLDVLDHHVDRHGFRSHLHILNDGGDEQALTYKELLAGSQKIAAGLQELGLEGGERVAVMLPTGLDFFVSFFGVLMAGAIPVPIYPPFRRALIEDHLRRQAGILRNSQAAVLISDAEITPLAGLLKGLSEDLATVTTAQSLSTLSKSSPERVRPQPEETALIQYTSGSTGDPKGVVLSHANLLSNIRAMGGVMQASSKDTFVSWLPLYHDMGLIGAWLGSLYYGAPVAFMPPLAFLADPTRWLWSIHRHGGTLSAAPNFAFELCLRSIRDSDIEGLDLSTLRMVVNGAEPVSPSTIRRFTDRFRHYGFREEALAPVYGLAECSVGLAFPPPGRVPIIDRIRRNELARDGRAVPAEPDDAAVLEFVACGLPLPGHQIRIVDEAGMEVPDRRQGLLQFKGPSATKGYYRNPEKTAALFKGEWLDSGDLAYIAAGDVFLTGRVKDIIIRAGRNIYPHELEEEVGELQGVRKGCVVAFASRDERVGSERLVIIAETRLTGDEAKRQLKGRINNAALMLLEEPPDEVILVPPRTIPKTSSGKLRRSAARELYEKGKLRPSHRALWIQLAVLALEGFWRRGRRTLLKFTEYLYAGYWWVLLVAFGLVLWPLVALLPRRSWRHAAVGAAGRWFLTLTGTSLVIEGDPGLAKRGVIIVANHSSYLDGLILSVALPGELTFIAKHEFKSQFVFGTFLKRLGSAFVHRVDVKSGLEDTTQLLEAARRGQRLVAFPEGTFARMPGLLPFRLGAFLVAAAAERPVLPVTIKGTRMILREVQWFPRRGSISVVIGAPIQPDGTDFAAAVRLRNRCRAEILARSDEPDLVQERIDLPPD